MEITDLPQNSVVINTEAFEPKKVILDMIRRCRDAGLPEPEFNDSSGFKITIWRATPTEQIKVQPESLPEL